MFWSIPSVNKEIRVLTPNNAKSIRAVYFENRTSQCFESTPQCSITIGGREITKDLFVLPFMTTNKEQEIHKWQDVAINLNINVNKTEVVIKCNSEADYNIVFVLSNKEVDERERYEYFETIFIDKTLKEREIGTYYVDEFVVKNTFTPTHFAIYGPKIHLDLSITSSVDVIEKKTSSKIFSCTKDIPLRKALMKIDNAEKINRFKFENYEAQFYTNIAYEKFMENLNFRFCFIFMSKKQ